MKIEVHRSSAVGKIARLVEFLDEEDPTRFGIVEITGPELARRIGMPLRTLQRTIARAESLGLIRRTVGARSNRRLRFERHDGDEFPAWLSPRS